MCSIPLSTSILHARLASRRRSQLLLSWSSSLTSPPKLHCPRQTALRKAVAPRQTNLHFLFCLVLIHTRPRPLTYFHLPSHLLLQPHLHSHSHRWKMLASRSQSLLLPAYCQSLITLICWSERCILTVGLDILLLISQKADGSIATSLLSLRSGFA